MIVAYSAASVWFSLFVPENLRAWCFLACLLVGVVCFRKRALVLAVFLAITASSIALNTHPQLREIAQNYSNRQVTITAVEDGAKLTKVRIDRLEGCPSCAGAFGQFMGALAVGDTAAGNLLIRPAFGYGEFVARGNLDHITRADKSIRNSFVSNARGVSEDSKALVLGLAVGDTTGFSAALAAQFKALSLTHLAAVSGANCAIVVGAVFWMLGFVIRRRWLRTSLALLALVAYVALVGPQPSVLRAAIMAALVLMAVFRGVWPLAALSWAAALLLWWQPNYARDYGFALSVLATAGILILAPRLATWLRTKLPAWLALSLAVSLAAQLWCMPVLLELQGGVPTYAVLANLLAEPAVAPITLLGILAASLSSIAPLLTGWLTLLASIPAQWIVAIAHWLSGLPAVTLAWHTGLAGMIALAAGVTAFFGRAKKLGAMTTSLVLAVELGFSVFGAARAATWLPTNWEILNCDVGQGDGLVIRSRGEIAVVDVGRNDQPIRDCLNGLGITEINLLVLTHYDADHIGGLAGAIQGRKVDRVLLTPFRDTRPIVATTARLLTGIPKVETAGVGTTGSLGDDSWEVLSPTATASEAEDSNDGSVVMRWESEHWVLYTMADLGERGQIRMAERFGGYLSHPTGKWLILKVSHHGSADQYPELIEAMHPDLALISVGAGNSYGHPTQRTLAVLQSTGARVLRTDLSGELAVFGSLRYAVARDG